MPKAVRKPTVKISVKKTGDWAIAREILKSETKLKNAISAATRAEAERARAEIIKGIKDQAPGGKKFKKLDAWTLITREFRGFGGTKALIVSAAMMNAIKVIKKSPTEYEVGIPASEKKRVGGVALRTIGRINENGGSITIRVTPKMKKFLAIMIRRAQEKLGKRDAKGRFTSKSLPGNKGSLASGTIVVNIPPRPFIGPVMEQIKRNAANVNRRLEATVAKMMEGKFGK